MQTTDLRFKLPYQEITPKGSIITGDGQISAGFAVSGLHELFTVDSEKQKNILRSYKNILSMLPSNGKLQIYDHYKVREYIPKDESHFVRRENGKYHRGKKYLEHRQEMFVSVNPHGKIKRDIFSPKLIGIKDYLKERPYCASAEAVQDFERACSAIVSMIGGKGHRMDRNETFHSICRHFRQDQDYSADKDMGIPPIGKIGGSLTSGGRHIKIVSLINEPDILQGISPVMSSASKEGFNMNYGEVQAFMPYPIHHGLLCDHTVCTVIEIFDRQEIEEFVNLRAKSHNILAVLKIMDAVSLQRASERILHEASEDGKRICISSVTVMVSADTEKEAAKFADDTDKAFTSFGARAWIENEDDGNLLWACSPGNAGTNYRGFLTTIDRAVLYVNIETPLKGHEKGISFVERAFGKPVRLDIVSNTYTEAKHFGVFAPTRSGKTFFMQGLCEELLLDYSAHILLIDRGKSYRRLAKIIPGAKYFGASEFFSKGLNPLDCEKDGNGKYIYFDKNADSEELQQIDIALAVCSLIWKKGEKLNNDDSAILRELLVDFYEMCSEKNQIPMLAGIYTNAEAFIAKKVSENKRSEVYKMFPLDSLLLHLKEYCEGEKKNLLNADHNLDIVKDTFIVFEMGGVHGVDKELIEICIANAALSKFNRLSREIPKYLILDEAIDALTGVLGEKIGGFYRKAGKLGAGIGTVTQSVDYLNEADSLVRSSILSNMPIKILLGIENEEAQIKVTKDMLSLDERDLYMLASMNSRAHDIFIKVQEIPYILRYEVSPVTAALFTTTAADITRMDELELATGSIQAASAVFAAEHGYYSDSLFETFKKN